jgi:amino acid transporter
MLKTLTLASCSLGIILSPEMLRLLGNTAGASGLSILAAIAMATIIYALMVSAMEQNHTAPLMANAYGPVTTLVASLTGRVMFTATATAALVVTSGFIFNEVFYYRFPNFAFAYLLLAAVLVINLFGAKAVMRIQGALVLITLLCLGVLIIKGLISFEHMPLDKKPFMPSLGPETFAIAILLFIGFETAGIIEEGNKKAMIIALVIAGTILALWAVVSLMHVAPGKLSRTSIPFTIAARNIMGDTGRYLIGTAAITGSAAAVTTMLMGLKHMVIKLVKIEVLPPIAARYNIPALMGAMGAAGIMMAGFAGHDELKTAIRAGMILWALSYVFVAVAGFRLNKKPGGLIVAVTLLASIITAVLTSHESTHLIKMISYAIAISMAICYTLSKSVVREKLQEK